MSTRRPFPLYPCGSCGARRGYRLGIGGPWRCGGCSPVWELWRDLEGFASAKPETVTGTDGDSSAGVRTALAFADTATIAAEEEARCRSAQTFLRAVAAGQR